MPALVVARSVQYYAMSPWPGVADDRRYLSNPSSYNRFVILQYVTEPDASK
jgi:hypothetical protein